MNDLKKKTSEAQKRASAKYDKENMSFIGLKVPIAERELMNEKAKELNLPLARYIRSCVLYCIDNDIKMENIK